MLKKFYHAIRNGRITLYILGSLLKVMIVLGFFVGKSGVIRSMLVLVLRRLFLVFVISPKEMTIGDYGNLSHLRQKYRAKGRIMWLGRLGIAFLLI